jgi:Ca2+-binding RTX toxin-like protein
VGSPSKWGSWGALRHLDDANPRWDVLQAYNHGVAAWWEERPSAAFANGVIRRGTGAADELRGTGSADILLGAAGDDVLVGGNGADRLHGGAGTDVALMPGRRDDYRLSREGVSILAEGPDGVVRLVSIETLRFTDDPATFISTASLP